MDVGLVLDKLLRSAMEQADVLGVNASERFGRKGGSSVLDQHEGSPRRSAPGSSEARHARRDAEALIAENRLSPTFRIINALYCCIPKVN